MRVLLALAKVSGGLDKRATTILSDMTPASSGDTGVDMPRPILDCGPYANTVRQARLTGSRSRGLPSCWGGAGEAGSLSAGSQICLRAASIACSCLCRPHFWPDIPDSVGCCLSVQCNLTQGGEFY
jgi:hypothetical protein